MHLCVNVHFAQARYGFSIRVVFFCLINSMIYKPFVKSAYNLFGDVYYILRFFSTYFAIIKNDMKRKSYERIFLILKMHVYTSIKKCANFSIHEGEVFVMR